MCSALYRIRRTLSQQASIQGVARAGTTELALVGRIAENVAGLSPSSLPHISLFGMQPVDIAARRFASLALLIGELANPPSPLRLVFVAVGSAMAHWSK